MVLKEKLTLHGKIGCALCIVGAVVIVLHAPGKTATKKSRGESGGRQCLWIMSKLCVAVCQSALSVCGGFKGEIVYSWICMVKQPSP